MGFTSNTGWYQQTKGDFSNLVSNVALKHIETGEYTRNPKTNEVMRLKSGGHTQKALDIMRSNGLGVHIEKTFDNGVRVGFIDKAKNPIRRKSGGQTFFPSNWSTQTISSAIRYVARLKRTDLSVDGMYSGTYKRVRVKIRVYDGKIVTAFPDNKQGG